MNKENIDNLKFKASTKVILSNILDGILQTLFIFFNEHLKINKYINVFVQIISLLFGTLLIKILGIDGHNYNLLEANKYEILCGILGFVVIVLQLSGIYFTKSSYISLLISSLLPIVYYVVQYISKMTKTYNDKIHFTKGIKVLFLLLLLFIMLNLFSFPISTISFSTIIGSILFIFSVIIDSYILHYHKQYGREDNPNHTMFIYYSIIFILIISILFIIMLVKQINIIEYIKKIMLNNPYTMTGLISIILINIITGYFGVLLKYYNLYITSSIDYSMFRNIVVYLRYILKIFK